MVVAVVESATEHSLGIGNVPAVIVIVVVVVDITLITDDCCCCCCCLGDGQFVKDYCYFCICYYCFVVVIVL